MQLNYPGLDKLTPSDAYHESPAWKRMVYKCETRIALLRPTSLVHETVLTIRNSTSTTLDPRSNPVPHMLTPGDLMKVGWDIKTCVAARNGFEALKQASASVTRSFPHLGPCVSTDHQETHNNSQSRSLVSQYLRIISGRLYLLERTSNSQHWTCLSAW